jgi:hypothetical protein
MDIVAKMYTVGQAHDFKAETLGLNSAWSLCQGFRGLSELKRRGARLCHFCGTIKEKHEDMTCVPFWKNTSSSIFNLAIFFFFFFLFSSYFFLFLLYF